MDGTPDSHGHSTHGHSTFALDADVIARGCGQSIAVDRRASGALAVELGPSPLRCAAGVSASALTKRAFDIVISLSALILLLPVFALLAMLIRLDSRGPIFFRTKRVGLGGRTLAMLKFRKMHQHADGIGLTLHDDARFTRVGILLARSKLDELPQLWHVLRGEMSLVGPRPESHRFAAEYPMEFARVTRTKPGIIGLSQLAFSHEGEVLDPGDPVKHYLSRILPQKIQLDLMYEEMWSFWLDIRILVWALVVVVARRPVAVNRRNAVLNLRRRNKDLSLGSH